MLRHPSQFSADSDYLGQKIAEYITGIYRTHGDLFREYLLLGLEKADYESLERIIFSHNSIPGVRRTHMDQSQDFISNSPKNSSLNLDFTKAFSS